MAINSTKVGVWSPIQLYLNSPEICKIKNNLNDGKMNMNLSYFFQFVLFSFAINN